MQGGKIVDNAALEAAERRIFERIRAFGGTTTDVRECNMVHYPEGWRAHAFDGTDAEIHVTLPAPAFEDARRALREWAVEHDLHYGGGYARFDNPEHYRRFWEVRREREAENGP
jgi:hypothetical protein